MVLLTPHFCNWEWLLLAGGATFGLPIDAVYQTLRVESVDRYFREARSRFGGKPFPRQDFVYELMSRAGTPRAYGLIADQTPPRGERTHWTRLLNRDTAFFVGAEKIARFLDATVLYVAMRRVRRGHYSVRFRVLAEPPYVRDAEGEDSPIMEGFARELERAILESPADWLWVQKRWKYPKPADALTPGPGNARSGPAPDGDGREPARRHVDRVQRPASGQVRGRAGDEAQAVEELDFQRAETARSDRRRSPCSSPPCTSSSAGTAVVARPGCGRRVSPAPAR